MLRFARKLWFRLPIDGSGAIPLCSPRRRLFGRVAARGFWERMPRGSRSISIAAARILWFVACPIKAAVAMRSASPRRPGFFKIVWAGWTLGQPPLETIECRSMARGDRVRLHLLREIPPARQGVLLMAALGDPVEMSLAADKLAIAERLAELGLPAPVTISVVRRGQIPDPAAPPWSCAGKLVIKPRHGSASRGLSSIATLGDGLFSIAGNPPVSRMELAHVLMRRATRDDLLVQRHVAPSDATLDLSPDAPIAIRAFTMRHGPGQPVSLLSAFLKIAPPGALVPRDTTELLVVPVAIDTGVLEDGILFDRPGERWNRMPWNGAPVTGRTIGKWGDIANVAVRASETMPNTPLIGWDILLGPDGPVILEANTGVSLFRAALWHFEHGLPSPLFAVLENWCIRQER